MAGQELVTSIHLSVVLEFSSLELVLQCIMVLQAFLTQLP